uniref:Uncharacterized protein n=1 Tax=Anopheles farauti TaxID=69004 RepID=A0A182QVU1_9DIPT
MRSAAYVPGGMLAMAAGQARSTQGPAEVVLVAAAAAPAASPPSSSSSTSRSSSGVVLSVGNGCSGWKADPRDGFSWNAVVHGLKQAVFVLVSASVSFKLTLGKHKRGKVDSERFVVSKQHRYMHTFSQPSGGSRARNLLILGEALVVTAPSSGEVLWLPSSDDSVSPSGVCVFTDRVSPPPPTSDTAPAP